MKKSTMAGLTGISVIAVMVCVMINYSVHKKQILHLEQVENEDEEMGFVEQRVKYEYDMLKDPATGVIPARIFEQELAFARTLPEKDYGSTARGQDLNNYLPAGPNNIGGRARGLAYDVRYNGATNRVILSGSVSGGIMRSADGGATWTRVSPDNDVHNLSVIAQDPRPGSQDTWYAGTGESIGNSASELGAPFYGFGVFKSINNGVSWTKLTMTNITDIPGNVPPGIAMDMFDNPFDYVHDIEINPVNGHVYISGHRRLLRSTDGGTSFVTVFGGTVGAIAAAGQFDVEITSTGKIILAVNGG